MSLYVLKPIVWNSAGYQQPAGGDFMSGFPKDNGFGHEEWNAADHLALWEAGEQWRVFHTEGLGKQEVDEHAGDIFVFMLASHQGHQYLMGVAGNATSLHASKRERRRLAALLGTHSPERAAEAWRVPQVQQCYSGDRAAFMRQWRKDADWGPTWMCPAAYFVWLDAPVRLEPEQITGKKRLVTMYSSYQVVDQYQAAQLLRVAARSNTRVEALRRLAIGCSSDTAEEEQDIQLLNARRAGALTPTQKAALIQARRGQGKFREDLRTRWNGCAVTGCNQPEVLRASHIKPWRRSTDEERLDPANGLLLIANVDALFDAGLLTFSDDGSMQISGLVGAQERQQLALTETARLRLPVSDRTREHLAFHRRYLFRAN